MSPIEDVKVGGCIAATNPPNRRRTIRTGKTGGISIIERFAGGASRMTNLGVIYLQLVDFDLLIDITVVNLVVIVHLSHRNRTQGAGSHQEKVISISIDYNRSHSGVIAHKVDPRVVRAVLSSNN